MTQSNTLSMALLLGAFLILNLSITPAEGAEQTKHHRPHHPHKGRKHSHMRQQVDSPIDGAELYNPNSNLLDLDLSFGIQFGIGRAPNPNGKVYNLTLNSAGNDFFDDWDFFSEADPTHGLVSYQPVSEAWKHDLVAVGPSSVDKNLITAKMKVDNTNWLGDGEGRKSIRLSSKKRFKYGLLVLDAIKMPFGCSTWPAFWTVGDNWPQDGEIDIVEGVNLLSVNQMTVHTAAGCNLSKPMGLSAVGNVLNTNCDVHASSNLGCGVHDRSNASYGEPFNQRGGGVFAMEWSPDGISIWRFNRGEVPLDLQSGRTPQPSTWAIHPSAHWSNDDCNNLSEQFSEHRIIFDITLCGDWAGSNGVFNANNACSGSCTDMVKDPSNYHNANWEIASVKLYE